MRLSVSLVAAALLAACAGSTPEPEAPAAESARTGPVALPNAIEQDGVEVGFVDAVPEEKARLILAEALRARAAVDTYFGSSLGAVRIRISNERRIPIATRGAIYLPADRIDQVTADWTSDPMSITHEMTHLLGSGNRPDRLLIEGLAVHVNHAVGRPTYPNDGEDLDALTLRLQAELGKTIPLVESERHRRNGSRAERRLAYTQEGSFARYYINRYGLKAFLDLVMADTAYENEPELWQRLEAEWRASLK
jgi:hypothetical protein